MSILMNSKNKQKLKVIDRGMPVGDKVILAVDMKQKSDFEFTTEGGLRLWGNTDFGHDEKKTRPTIAEVVASRHDDLLAGDVVLCHHHTFSREVNNGYLLGDMDTDTEDGRQLFAIERALIHFKVGANGEAIPLSGFITALRIERKYEGVAHVVIPESVVTTYANQFRVLEVGPDCEGVEPGDVVIAYPKSDYKMEYTYNGRMRTCIRIKYSDILATAKDVVV